jgi:hypothetical protein
MGKWYTFTGRDCHSITFKANEDSAYQQEALRIMRNFEEATLREATERERKAAISAHNLDAFAEIDFEKLLDDDVFPYVTARMI